ncbi:MAG: hypothetical protein EOP43_03790, partial [Sphingobacteriaceae bacterium]
MKNLFVQYYNSNPYYKFIPFLIIYLLICVLFAPPIFVLDEKRYIDYGHELLRGFYSYPAPNIRLWSGRGYSALIVAPLLWLNLPLMAIRLVNGVLMYLSLVLVYKSIRTYSSAKSATIFTVILGLYYPVYEKLPNTETECFTWFLISLISYLFIKNFKERKLDWKWIWLCGFAIAYLAMTK